MPLKGAVLQTQAKRLGQVPSGYVCHDLSSISNEYEYHLFAYKLVVHRGLRHPFYITDDPKAEDPVLEERMREYFHLQKNPRLRRFYTYIYHEEIAEYLELLEELSGDDLFDAGIQEMDTGNYPWAYSLFSLALLKNCDHAKEALEEAAQILRERDRMYHDHIFERTKEMMNRVTHFARKC